MSTYPTTVQCVRCGSEDVFVLAYVNINTREVADYVDVDGKFDEGAFCPNCAQSDYFASYNTQLRFKGLPSNVSAG
jgi:Zn ribbon nucleic-acid-binding protein